MCTQTSAPHAYIWCSEKKSPGLVSTKVIKVVISWLGMEAGHLESSYIILFNVSLGFNIFYCFWILS